MNCNLLNFNLLVLVKYSFFRTNYYFFFIINISAITLLLKMVKLKACSLWHLSLSSLVFSNYEFSPLGRGLVRLEMNWWGCWRRMNWERLSSSYSRTNRIYPTRWMLPRSQINLASIVLGIEIGTFRWV